MKRGNKWIPATAALVCSLGGAFLAGRALAGGIPATRALTYSGLLENASGTPLTGTHSVQVSFFTAASGGTPTVCYTSPTGQETLDAGRFSVPLDDTCASVVKASKDVWSEVLVDGVSLGRTKLGAVPYAIEAGHSTAADTAMSATTATNASNASNATAGGGIATTLASLQSSVSSLGLKCALREGGQSRSATFFGGSSVACTTGEVLTGGVCTPYSGRCGPIVHLTGNTIECALSNPSADANDYVVAQGVCCKL